MSTALERSKSLSKTISLVLILPEGSVPEIQFLIFIFLGSERLSVHKSKSSIMFIPVIILFALNSKTSSLPTALFSINTGVTSPEVELYFNIAFLNADVINQYIASFFPSSTTPIQVEPLGIKSVSISKLPKIFCTAPTSAPSEVEICMFIASLYSPLGTSLSSRSLFILPAEKTCLISGIY